MPSTLVLVGHSVPRSRSFATTVAPTIAEFDGSVTRPVMPALMSQEISAGITGRVTDPSNSAIVGATVVAKDLDRGTEWPTKTNVDGIYAFPRIPAGEYEVRVEAPGFKRFVQSRLRLDVNQR